MIKVLGEDKERGKLFEDLLKKILSKQGYGQIESNIHTTGTEIDIEAKDNVSKSRLRIEAKAHSLPIDTPELKKFILTAQNDIQKGLIDSAVFWSLSGINSTARHYFEHGLTKEIKNHITINGENEFQQILVEIGIIGNESVIENNAKDLVKKNLLGRDLIYYKNQWYFIQYCSQEQDPTHFFILDNFGKPVEDIVCREIRNLDKNLKKLELILLNTKKRILEFLLQQEYATLNEIMIGLKETKTDIQTTIEELKDQELIKQENTEGSKYSLNKEMNAFLTICKEFLKDKKMLLMKSNYFTKTMTIQVVEYIKNRWALQLSSQDSKLILKMCLVSPSAVEYALFSSTSAVQNLLEQYNNQIPSQIQKIIRPAFLTQITISVLTDIHHNQALGLQKTRGALIDINLRMATEDELFFKIHTKAPLVTMKIKGSIKQGQILAATGPETFLESSMIFHSLGNIKMAIKEIDAALKAFPNKGEWLQAAYINKGMCLSEIGKLKEAERLLVKATKQFPKQNRGWLNLGNLYLKQNKIRKAKECFEKTSSLEPNYAHPKYGLARIAILEKDKKLCLELLEEVFKLEKRFVTRVQLDKEFQQIKKSKEYNEVLKKLNLPKRI